LCRTQGPCYITVVDAGQTRQPFFVGMNIDCPSCGYSLCGLVEPRCPECGKRFDPEKLRQIYVHFSQVTPPLAWVVPFLYLHPVHIWSTPQVRLGRAPTAGALIGMLTVMSVIALVCLVFFAMMALLVIDPQGSAGWLLFVLFWGAILGVAGLLVLMLLMAVHWGLCHVLLVSSAGQTASGAAAKIVGYGWAWAPPAAALLLCERIGFFVGRGGTGAGALIGLLPIVLLPAVCLPWAISNWAGALRLGKADPVRALLCVLANPFWYILGFIHLWLAG
jgi:hypothetical protein